MLAARPRSADSQVRKSSTSERGRRGPAVAGASAAQGGATGQRQPDDRLGVGQLAPGRPGRRASSSATCSMVMCCSSIPWRSWSTGSQAGGQVDHDGLVAAAGRVVELAQPLEAGRPPAPSPRPARGPRSPRSVLAGHVAQPGGDLQQQPVDGGPVLAHHDHRPSSSRGTTATAPGWWTMSRSKVVPSGARKVPIPRPIT